LAYTIGFINTATLRTSPGRISRINENQGNTHAFGFVGDVLAELIERPVTMLASLRAANRSLADTAQVFQSDSPTSVLRFLNKPFTDRVIGMLLETCLLSREFFEFAFGRLGLFFLQVLSAMLKYTSIPLYIRPAEVLPIGIGSDIHNAQVHPENAFHVNRFGCFNVARGKQIELVLYKAKIALPALSTQEFHLPFSSSKPDALAACESPNRHFHFFEIIGKDTVIKSNCTMRLENALSHAIRFISIGHFGDTTHNHLGGQWKAITDIPISQFVQRELPQCFALPTPFADVITSLVGSLKRLFEKLRLVWRRKEFYLGSQFHKQIVSLFQYIEKKGGRFLPAASGRGIRACFL
jgi:hypothetical protein